MKQTFFEFVRRGLIACGLGPLVLAVLYLCLARAGKLESLTVAQVATGIFSISALAFVSGGMNVLYQVERLPLMAAVSIHGVVLYVCYLITYLLNDWLEWGKLPMLVFTVIFVAGYLAIWAILYILIKKKTARLNEMLKEKQQTANR